MPGAQRPFLLNTVTAPIPATVHEQSAKRIEAREKPGVDKQVLQQLEARNGGKDCS